MLSQSASAPVLSACWYLKNQHSDSAIFAVAGDFASAFPRLSQKHLREHAGLAAPIAHERRLLHP